jgi:hypothetical protein
VNWYCKSMFSRTSRHWWSAHDHIDALVKSRRRPVLRPYLRFRTSCFAWLPRRTREARSAIRSANPFVALCLLLTRALSFPVLGVVQDRKSDDDSHRDWSGSCSINVTLLGLA